MAVTSYASSTRRSTVSSPDAPRTRCPKIRCPRIRCPRISCLRFAPMPDKRQSRYLYRTCSCISLPSTIRTGDILDTIHTCSRTDTVRCFEVTSALFTRIFLMRDRPREHMIGSLTKRLGIRVLQMPSRKESVKPSKGTDPPGKGIPWVRWKLQGSACVSDNKSLSVRSTTIRACGGL